MTLAYFLSHPVQYQSPLLRRLHEEGFLITTVYADISSAGPYFNADYGETIFWKQNLLEDYVHEVIHCPHMGDWVLPWIPKLRRWLQTHRPDAVWIHGWGTSYSQAALIAAYSLRIPILLRGETHLDSRRGTKLWKALHYFVLRKIFKRVDHFLAIGKANEALYKYYDVPSKKITSVPYVTDNSSFEPYRENSRNFCFSRRSLKIPDSSRILLYTGRFSREKGLFDLLYALRDLQQHFPELPQTHLLLAGSGPLKNKLQSWANRHLPNRVTFTGFIPQDQLPCLYSLCDIFVLPSHHEPWGMVVNEVMNAGKPLLLSDRVGAGFDLLVPGVNGYSFTAGDNRQLTEALARLVGDPTFLETAGNHSRNIISQWNLDRAVEGMRSATHRLAKITPPPCTQIFYLSHNKGKHINEGVVLAYAGVHEIFQMAQAANEHGLLERLYCSLFDGPGKLGRPLSRLTSIPSATALGTESLPASKVHEIPLPLFARQGIEKIYGKNKIDPLITNLWFEKFAARELHKKPRGRIAVGSETCSLHWFQAAKQYGMHCILDCHGIPAPFLDASLQQAVSEFHLPDVLPSDSDTMRLHKQQEREIADILLFCSELQRDIMVNLGIPAYKTRVAPLWVDTKFWRPAQYRPSIHSRLKVVFAGTATLPKGLPYLLSSVDSMAGAVELSLVGWVSPQIRQMIRDMKYPPALLGQLDRHKLRDFFHTQHILILPSLGDSFGFVAMEAMACGLPVVITNNCGAPVPQVSWRVPSHDSAALAMRMQHYLSKPHLLTTDSIIARQFAEKFPPSAYREKVAAIYQELLV